MIEEQIEILIPSFKGEKYLPLCLMAIAQGTARDFVIRLGPEGPWNNRELIERLIAWLGLRAIIDYSEEHIGLARNRSRLLSSSSAELVLWVDDDVLVSPDSIQRLIQDVNKLGSEFSILTGVGSNLGHPTVTCGLGFTLCQRTTLENDIVLTHDFGLNTGEDCLWTARIVYKTGLPIGFVPSLLHHIGEGRRRKRYGVRWNDEVLPRYTSEEFFLSNLDELRYSYPVYNYMDY
jgi:hypothetical protein